MAKDRSEILQGTLDLMVLKTLQAMGPLHGYGIARRIEQISEEVLRVNQGTIYASLVRLLQRDWISTAWCGFRGKPVTIPKLSRAAFRNDPGHDSGVKPVTDSDFKPVTFRRRSEP